MEKRVSFFICECSSENLNLSRLINAISLVRMVYFPNFWRHSLPQTLMMEAQSVSETDYNAILTLQSTETLLHIEDHNRHHRRSNLKSQVL